MQAPLSQKEVRSSMRGLVAMIGALAIGLTLVVLIYGPYPFVFHEPDAVSLGASLNSTAVLENQTVKVSLSDTNSLPFPNEASGSSSWTALNITAGPCGGTYPMGVAVYQGRYTLANISSANSMQIYAPGVYSCPAFAGAAAELDPLQTVTKYVELDGYWTAGFTNHTDGNGQGILHPFIPGLYTVIVGDEWGHLGILYFQVGGISLQNFSLCTSDCNYPSPYLSQR